MAISSLVKYIAEPTQGLSVYVIKYTKAGATDFLTASLTIPVNTILYAKAMIDLDGSDDPLIISGATITLSTGTGAGRCLIVAKS
jgi:hypothetical protein